MSQGNESESTTMRTVFVVGLISMLYLGSFGLLYLDEVVFSTHWVDSTLPISPDIFRIIYWPLLKLFGFL